MASVAEAAVLPEPSSAQDTADPANMDTAAAEKVAPGADTSPESAEKMGLVQRIRLTWDSVRMTVFVLGSAMVVLIAARNTLTWHAQKLWGFSGSYWQRRWDNIYDFFGEDPATLGILGTCLVTSMAFFGFNSLLIFLDMTGRPKYLLRYKIQDAKEVPLPKWKMWKCLRVVLRNHIFITIPGMGVLYYLMQLRGCSFGRELPTFHWVLFELVVYSLVEELGFFYSHWLLHSPFMYARVHKFHHEWKQSIGMVGVYCHPIEHIMSNIVPTGLGPLLMGSHVATMWFWFSLAFVQTSISHCGYHFPFLPSPEAHDYHHLKFNNCFGVLGVLDRLHGTDTQFLNSKQHERHFMSMTLVPVREQIPDVDPKGKKSPEKTLAKTK